MTTTKTAREHFAELSAPVGLLALRNAAAEKSDLDKEYKTPEEAIARSFSWRGSKQGFNFWAGFCKDLVKARRIAKKAESQAEPKSEVINEMRQYKYPLPSQSNLIRTGVWRLIAAISGAWAAFLIYLVIKIFFR